MAADGSVVLDVDMNVSQANKQLAKLRNNIEKTEQEISETTKKRDEAQQKSLFDAAELDAEKEKLQEIKDRLADIKAMSKDKTIDLETREGLKAQIPAVKEELADQQTRVRMLQTEWNKTEASVERYNQKIAASTSKLDEMKDEAGNLQERINKAELAQLGMAGAVQKADAFMNALSKRIGKLASRVFVFTLITAALRSMRTWLSNTVKSNDEAAAAIAKLKGALLTLSQPIVNVIIPAFITLVNVLTKVVSAIASVVSMIFGTTAEKSAEAAESLYNQQKGLKGVGSAAKKAGKQLAGFDEINKISSDDAGGVGTGGAGAGIEPNFDNSFIKDGIDGVLDLLVGMALFAVGAILTFSGTNVPVGVALMVAGIMTTYAAAQNNPNLASMLVRNGLDLILQVVGGFLAVIGIVLLVTGNIALGIGLILEGITLFSIGKAAGEDGDFATNVKTSLIEAANVLAPLLAVIGLLLICTGNIALGLGLFISGIALFKATEEVGDDGKSLQEKITSVLTTVATVVAPVLAVIGIFLMITGNLFLGLGFLIAGVSLFAIGEAATDDGKSIQEKITTVLTTVASIIAPVLGVIGIFFMITGNLFLGLGFLIAGIALFGISEVAGDDGKNIGEKITSVLSTVAKVIAPVLGVIGIFFLITGNLLAGLGFLIAGIALFNIGEQAGDDGKSMDEKITSIMTGIATGLTVLGAALLVIGIVLMFTGAAAALGLGMIVSGAGMLIAGAITPNWDYIKEAIKNAYESMKQWWDSSASKFFSAEYWAGLAKNMLDGLFGGLKNLGSRISEWGGSFINGVKDFFGIHSPSTEFEGLGGYMMAGLQNGVGDNSEMVVSAFSVMFTAITALCTQNTDLMKAAFVAFLLYLTTEFEPKWMKSWQSNYQNAHSSIQMVMSDIDALNRKLAAIERNITITITTIRKEISEGGGSSSSSKSASPSMARMAAMPAIQQSSIPALAKGAVIPPNRKFLAVLGDQRNGNNLEGPEDMFRNIVRQEMGNNSQMISLLQAILSAVKEGKTIEVDRQTFGRVVHKANSEESRRVGVSFAEG